MKTAAALLIATAALCACGKVGPLEPAPGASMPPKTYGQTSAVDPQALIEPSPQARPARSDELLQRSQVREPDPFDLPPAGRQSTNDADVAPPPPTS